jgi:hypothetical protein
MTALTQFAPTPLAPFQFQATLDGATYNVITTWNVFGQRWYVNIVDQNNNRILTKPLVGSPPDYAISLVAGYFTSTMVFLEATQTFAVAP